MQMNKRRFLSRAMTVAFVAVTMHAAAARGDLRSHRRRLSPRAPGRARRGGDGGGGRDGRRHRQRRELGAAFVHDDDGRQRRLPAVRQHLVPPAVRGIAGDVRRRHTRPSERELCASRDSSHLPCEARARQSAQLTPVAPARVRVDVPSRGTSAQSSGRATQPDAACADNGTCAESRRDEVGRCGCRSRRPGPGAGPARGRGENRGGDLRCPTSPGPRSIPGVRCRSRSGQRPGCRHFDRRGCSARSDAPSRGLRSIAFG